MIETMRVDQPQTPMITTDNDCNDWHDCHNCHDKRIEMIPSDNNERVDDMTSADLENKIIEKLDKFLKKIIMLKNDLSSMTITVMLYSKVGR